MKNIHESTISFLRKLASASNIETVLEHLHKAIERIGIFQGAMYILNDLEGESLQTRFLHLPDSIKHVESMYRDFCFPLEENDPLTQAFSKQELIIMEKDDSGDSSATRLRMKRWKLESLAIIPILIEKECLGCVLGLHQETIISKDDCKAVINLLEEAAPYIKTMTIISTFEREKNALALARAQHDRYMEFITTINNLTSDDPLYDAITSAFLEQYPFDFCGVVLNENNALKLKRLSVQPDADQKIQNVHRLWLDYYQDNPYELNTSDGATSVCFLHNSRLSILDAMEILHMPMSERDHKALELMETPRTFHFFVIRRGQNPIGVLWLLSMSKTIELEHNEVMTIEQSCNFIGTAIYNAKLYHRVEAQSRDIEILNKELAKKVKILDDMAHKDSLTGLYNFGFFREELQRLIHEYNRCRQQSFLSLIIIDIDHFKKFNDTHGHVAGNVALSQVAQLIAKMSRKMDVACRYGGEEFSIILPKCNIQGAVQLAERIRGKVETEQLEIDGKIVSVTISVGCAQFNPDEDISSFVTRADQALYQAKAGGRNRVEMDA